MIAIKTIVAVSALASASAFSAITLPSVEDRTAGFAERFSVGSQLLVPAVKTVEEPAVNRKIDKLVALDKFCAGQQWPYIAPECLVAGKGLTVRHPARVVSVERRVGDDTATLAQR